MNIALLDNSNSKEVILSILNEIDGINHIEQIEDFDNINFDFDIDIIIFDVESKNIEEKIAKIRNLYSTNKNIYLVAASYEINSNLVVQILKEQNVKEFVLKPVVKPILENAIRKIEGIKNNTSLKKANTISVFSNKGGVGKTSLAINTGYELSVLSKGKVCLIDLNYGQSYSFLNIKPKFDPDYIVSNIEKSDEKLFFSLIDRYKDSSFYLFSPSNSLDKVYSEDTLIKTINYFKTFFSYIIIDLPSNVDKKTASLILNSDMTLLVLIYSLASIKNTKQCLEFFENISYNKNKTNLILNRFKEDNSLTIKEIEKELGKEIFNKIPNNYITLNDAIERCMTLNETNPNSNIYKAYKKLASDIMNVDFEDLRNETTIINHGIYNLIRRMGD